MVSVAENCICCVRCDSVDRFFKKLRAPNCGIDFTDEDPELPRLLNEAAAYGCLNKSKPKKLVRKRSDLPKEREATSPVHEERPVTPVGEQNVENESPILQLETSNAEVNEVKQTADAATSYSCPITPNVQTKFDVSVQAVNITVAGAPSKSALANQPNANEIYTKSFAVAANDVSVQMTPQQLLPVNSLAISTRMIAQSPNVRRVSVTRPSIEPNELPQPEPVIAPISPSIVSMEYSAAPVESKEPVEPKVELPRKSKAAKRFTDRSHGNFTAPMYLTNSYYPCIVLPSPSGCQRRSERVRMFGNSGIIRHPETLAFVGVVGCSRQEFEKINDTTQALLHSSSNGHEVSRELQSELADGSGRIVLQEAKVKDRFVGVFTMTHSRATRKVSCGYFKFTVLSVKGEFLKLELREFPFEIPVGGQFVIQPEDTYALSVHPNKKGAKAVLAFDYVVIKK